MRQPPRSLKPAELSAAGTHNPSEFPIIPRGVEDGVVEFQDMEAAPQPLKLLRGIPKLTIRDTTPFEILDYIDQDEDALQFVSNMEYHPVLEVTLTLLAQSEDPVEKIFEMYEHLLRYVQSFEKLPHFKQEMDMDQNGRLTELNGIVDFPDESLEWNSLNDHENPYKISGWKHPVEAALKLAKVFASKEDSRYLKDERARVIAYFEPQYQRIFAAASHLVSFVKAEKHSGGLFCIYDDRCDHEEYPYLCASAMVLLQEYEAAFDRETPFHIKVHFHRYRSQYKRIYSTFGVGDILMNDLSYAVETKDYPGFNKLFPIAVDRLDDLFLEMLYARQKLFDWDLPSFNGRRCTIDTHTERSTDKIDWSCQEPDLAPTSLDDHVYSEVDDSDQYSEAGQDDDSDGGAGSEGDDQVADSGGEEGDAASEASTNDSHGIMEEDDDIQDEEVSGVATNEEDDEGAGPAEHGNTAILDMTVENLSVYVASHDHETYAGDLEVGDGSLGTIQLQQGWSTGVSIDIISATVQQLTGDWTFAPLSAVQDFSNLD